MEHSESNQGGMSKKERRAARRAEKDQRRAAEAAARRRKKLVGKAWIVVVLLAVVGLFWAAGREAGEDIAAVSLGSIASAGLDDHIKGGVGAPVTLVEYGDFQCPACGAFHPIVSEVADRYGDSLTVVYRHFPLRSIHPNAAPAAEASEAADLQGAFWPMHDLLYERQAEWSNLRDPEETFVGYAVELGLDAEQFEDDLGSDEVSDRVRAGERSGNAAGVNSTPSFFINGTRFSGSTVEDFAAAIDAAANAAGQAVVPALNFGVSAGGSASGEGLQVEPLDATGHGDATAQ